MCGRLASTKVTCSTVSSSRFAHLQFVPQGPGDSSIECAGRWELFVHLVSSARGGMPPAVLACIEVIIQKLNGDWEEEELVHRCPGPMCCSGGRQSTLEALLPALQDLWAAALCGEQCPVDRHVSVVAAQCLWLLVHNMGPRALQGVPQVAAIEARARASANAHARGWGPGA